MDMVTIFVENCARPGHVVGLVFVTLILLAIGGHRVKGGARYLLFFWMWQLLTPPRAWYVDLSLFLVAWVVMDFVWMLLNPHIRRADGKR